MHAWTTFVVGYFTIGVLVLLWELGWIGFHGLKIRDYLRVTQDIFGSTPQRDFGVAVLIIFLWWVILFEMWNNDNPTGTA